MLAACFLGVRCTALPMPALLRSLRQSESASCHALACLRGVLVKRLSTMCLKIDSPSPTLLSSVLNAE